MLEILGLSTDESRVYLALLERPNASYDDVAEVTGLAVEEIVATITLLEQDALVIRHASHGRPLRWVAAPPSVGLSARVVEKQRGLVDAQQEIERLDEIYRRGRQGRGAVDAVDVVAGPEAAGHRITQLIRAARDEVMTIIQSAPHPGMDPDLVEERRALERGVRFRAVAERGAMERPGLLAALSGASTGRIDVRVVRHAPCRLVVVDRDTALVPLRRADGATEGALVVHGGGLRDLTLGLFDRMWETAAPLLGGAGDGDASVAGLNGVDLAILRLLNAGLTDQKVASRLGLSSRTVQRRTARLMEAADVETRLQLGVVAARRGWL
ncbi:sugar-specific transcriptional regulator TrmB [Mumia flava]|uniref:Sugar-specific transcriptional regulator TrmB n=1 Tax=Mumia flava TaxID=1348852 RepID=A0A0B2BCV4_9ACTN|nr:helix-turn-helix domain-containing protein [Mumia flava]PJJ57573.1 sugar-specific transcriptional regulator TrmB [Mumia flava]